jgi:phosphoglycolate phosphatase
MPKNLDWHMRKGAQIGVIMRLNELLNYSNIVIQCHDVPDADAICSGYGIWEYLRGMGKTALLVYGGFAAVTKPSLLMLIEFMEIPLVQVETLPDDTDLLLTVDCQRGAGNVQKFPLPPGASVKVIDHHRPEITETENTWILPQLASCATVVYDMLHKEDFPISPKISSALYYGLYTDTNGLAEVRHPLDRDLAEQPYDVGMVRLLVNSAVSPEELQIIAETLSSKEMFEKIGLFCAAPCDANLLGFTSDIAKQVAGIDCCVVCCLQKNGIKLSIRSVAREIMSSEIAAYLCKGVGSGGGNIEKAGGFMSFSAIEKVAEGIAPLDYLRSKLAEYTKHYDYIYAGKTKVDFEAAPMYRKLPIPVGFVVGTDVFPKGTKITIRTLEGDVDTIVEEDIYFMIGVLGEIYPIRWNRFYKSYQVLEQPYTQKEEYQPVVINRLTGSRHEMLPYAKTCIPVGTKYVRAMPLTRDTKVFTAWDTEKYFFGSVGDYLTANEGGYDDCYIVRKDIFQTTYEEIIGNPGGSEH